MPESTQSMTGFGSGENDLFSVEIRSVNHRYMETYFRMPYVLNRHEVQLKKMIKEKFSRGRFDIAVQINPESASIVKVNTGLIGGLVKSLNDVKQEFSLGGEVTLDTVAGFKDVFINETAEIDEKELKNVFQTALSRLNDMRVAEGTNIKSDLLLLLQDVERAIEKIERQSEGIHEKIRNRVIERFHALLSDHAVDEGRLIQEASMMADRADITEEIMRLKSHIRQFRSILDNGGTIGKKLDFLLQEFSREANTIASKTSECGIIADIVDMKNDIEKLREQVQNVQ